MTTFDENPKIISQTDKPIEQDNNKTQKVDINVQHNLIARELFQGLLSIFFRFLGFPLSIQN